jgi:anaerobic selenocysteine-containing dehydrogenase
MNRKDAETLGIEDGEKVRVWNNRGQCELKAALGENVLEGVVVTQGLWGNSEDCPLVNSLTPDRIADMGNGATFFSGRVQVERIK